MSSWIHAVQTIASQSPEAVAIREGDDVISYRELLTRSERLARWLQEQGVKPGDRVGIHLRKGVEEILLTLAVLRIRACMVHLHPQLTLGQLNGMVRDSGLRTLFTENRRAREIQAQAALRAQLSLLVVIGAGEEEGALSWPSLESGDGPVEPKGDADRLAALLYTSGSTGRPKGVMHSQQNLLDFASNVAGYLELTASDRILGLLPISFGYGLNQLLSAFYVGATLVLPKAPFPAEVIRTLVSEEITGLAAVPSVWHQLREYLDEVPTELPALRYITSSGGTFRASEARRLRGHLPNCEIVLMYGSTECLRSTYLPATSFDAKPGSMGQAIPNVDVFIVNEEGALCAPGEVGQLVHRGAHVSQGYWKNEKATAESFRMLPALKDRYGDERMYWSGDLVKADSEGSLWFVSRSEWMVKSAGFRFSLAEVERTVSEVGCVSQAVAVIVEDVALGQAVEVFVRLNEGEAFDVEEIKRESRRSMPSYMLPKVFHLWEGDFPERPNGKLDRVALHQARTQGH